MTEKVESDISMKRYLLGELAEWEQQELEERLMTSNEFFEELLIAEDELVDGYLQGTLSPREQEKFNDHFLCTPERREKLKFARSLQRYVSTHAEMPRKAWAWPLSFSFLRASYTIKGWSMATALLMMVLGGSWLSVRTQLLQRGIEQARMQQASPTAGQQELQQQMAQLQVRYDQLANDLERQKTQSAAVERELAALQSSTSQQPLASMVAFALIPGRVRDMGGMNDVVIPPRVKWVQLQLGLGTGDYKRYHAVLQNAEGEEIWSESAPGGRVPGVNEVVLALPAGLLSQGTYILKLSGMAASDNFEDVATYQFRVVPK